MRMSMLLIFMGLMLFGAGSTGVVQNLSWYLGGVVLGYEWGRVKAQRKL